LFRFARGSSAQRCSWIFTANQVNRGPQDETAFGCGEDSICEARSEVPEDSHEEAKVHMDRFKMEEARRLRKNDLACKIST